MVTKYDELGYAEHILKKGFVTKYKRYELTLLVKKFAKDGLDKNQINKELVKFCKKFLEDYTEIGYYKIISSVISKGFKESLVVLNNITITNKELKYISNLDISDEYKRILLAFILNNKISTEITTSRNPEYKNKYIFNGNKKTYANIKKMANIPQRINISDAIFEMSQLGLFKPFMRGNIELSFIKDIEIAEDIFCKLSPYELDSVDLIWRAWNGDEKIGTCEECGRFIEITGNRTIYCKSCSDKKERENTKNRVKKHRKSKM